MVLEPRVEAGEWLVEKVIAALFTMKRHLRGPWYQSSIIMVSFPTLDLYEQSTCFLDLTAIKDDLYTCSSG